MFLSVALLSETVASAPPFAAFLHEPAHDSLILSALDRMHHGDYASADSQLAPLPDIAARAYFRGLIQAARCNDLGDTAALSAAEAQWLRLDSAGEVKAHPLGKGIPQSTVYRGLAQLQLSYVASQRHGRIRAARLGRKAAKTLEYRPEFAESEAALALFDYYKAELLKGVAWLPFVTADRAGPLKRLEAAIPRSRYLKDILQTSLLWIHYDAGRYDAGLPAIREFLSRYPGNRPARAMKADFLFRKGALDSALSIHQSLAAEYKSLQAAAPPGTRIPIGYLCSIGNLAKIHAAQGRRAELDGDLAIWYSPAHSGIMDWLPESLVREVGALKKEKQPPKGAASR